MNSRFILIGFLFCLLGVGSRAATEKRWQSVADDVYLQEVGRQIGSESPLLAVGLDQGRVFAGTRGGLLELIGDDWVGVPEVTNQVDRLAFAGGALWALSNGGLFRHSGDEWRRISEMAASDLAEWDGRLIASVGRRLWHVEDGQLQVVSTNDCPFRIERVIPHSGSVYVYGEGRLTFFEFGEFGGRDQYGFPVDLGWDWGALPSPTTRDAASVGARLLIATDRGLGVLRGMSMTALRGGDGLPIEDTTCLAPGFGGDVWVGTSEGAIRMTKGEYHYFAGRRWLPSDRVNAVAVAGHRVCIATDGGLGIVDYEPFTLAKKAEYYEKHLEAWGQKRMGFVHKLEWEPKVKHFVREVSDNDGGYSADYLAAESFRFGATHDPEARREARKTFRALLWLREMTGIPGFPARSVWAKGEEGHKASGGSGGYAAEWHDVAGGKFEWKGDTSSDELCAHFYAIGVFLELVAEGEEIAAGKEHLGEIARHLVDHHWQLMDLDGKPTRWGRWDPEYFLTDEGHFDRGLQSLEVLSFMKTAGALTGDERFRKAYEKLVGMGYPGYTLRQRRVFPPDSVLHFEDQLAFWNYWNLLRHEEDPDLGSLYRRSFERTWEVLRVEQEPWFNFVYGTITGNDCETGAAVRHLREWPLDLRVWSFQNSRRADLRTPSGYVALKAGIRPFSPRERGPMRLDGWTMEANGGTGGNDVAEPSAWLLSFWMGRYYGFIEAPAAADPGLIHFEGSVEARLGASPYQGPAHE